MHSDRPIERGTALTAAPTGRPGLPREWLGIRHAIRLRARDLLASFRVQLLGWFVLILALATVGSVVLVRQVLLQRVDVRVQAELTQEVAELTKLAEEGVDPATSQPFGGRVDRIFTVFLERNIPSEQEFLATFVDGQPHGRAGQLPPPLDPTAFASRWATASTGQKGRIATEVGDIDYLAVPYRVDGRPAGVFVVAIHTEALRADTEAATVAASIVGLVMLVIGSILARRLADRILHPVAAVTRTARTISESDLTQRMPVGGHDEISELAATFNEMLARLEASFGTQRRFIDDAGHELRTPITIIRGHLDVMSDEPEDRERTMAIVSDELDRVSRLIDDLLTLARADRPDFIRPLPIDIARLTEKMVATARGLDDERPWTMEGAARVVAMVDGQRLTEAVLQLAENAVRYSPPGSPVAIGSAVTPEEIRIWVRDKGPGISPEESDRIFDRFHRGSESRRTEGSGLGLSIVHAIAEAHGGRARVDSPRAGGAIFTIVVPHRTPPVE